MRICPVCKSNDEQHVVMKNMKISNDAKEITHQAEECHICKSCGIVFFVNITEMPKNI